MVDVNQLDDNTFLIYNVHHCDTRISASYWLDRTFGARQRCLCGPPRADLARGDLLCAAQLWTLRRPVNSDPDTDTFVIENFEFPSCMLALRRPFCLGGSKSVVLKRGLKERSLLSTRKETQWKFVPQNDGSFKILNKQFDSHALFTDGRRGLTSIVSMEEGRSESSLTPIVKLEEGSLWKLIPLFSASVRIDILWDMDNRQNTTSIKSTRNCPYGLTPMWRGSQEEKDRIMLLPDVKQALGNALDRFTNSDVRSSSEANVLVWQKTEVRSAIERLTIQSVNSEEEKDAVMLGALWNVYDSLTTYSVDGQKESDIVELKEALLKAIESHAIQCIDKKDERDAVMPMGSVKEKLQDALEWFSNVEREELLKRELKQAWDAKKIPLMKDFIVPDKKHCQVLQTSLVFESRLWEFVLYSSDIKLVEVKQLEQ